MPQRGRQFHGPSGGHKAQLLFHVEHQYGGNTHSPFQHDDMLIPTTWGKLATLELPPWKLCLQDSSALVAVLSSLAEAMELYSPSSSLVPPLLLSSSSWGGGGCVSIHPQYRGNNRAKKQSSHVSWSLESSP